ncbi:PhzF family phenazine biosynthesis protein [Verminephrobacter aporrectodeae]|uniref:PhzF family phenazine biosynthesis protein n=1 Tax=Verminephrobacter aporrectodeae TaxID=1110389 RepID=UPI0002376F89|nr:PhzF family phenazine biosynthesis protein [Verminephrobacter aporrectodeae]MCW5221994.1 PhzF family phenazine biosynthesis protein [Verminephrobacter aporrectodeae subsp. tuberculatae]MCW5291285.1 PhzF family phenazine biosynthesis protein [Verminephrobacter aporrectodeae subsp. tuberculatae]MCW8164313.1 PhzF family phenazine biosynthesis protein [Verminephrobacter aporrectodeae subsp. tuberculatae]MCW8168567.1 PhzF family phenazine biosynthesis protein [Verminephrobacter aporrectodeae subs
MHPRPFRQVDVFTSVPYRGNPLAVVLDGTDLATQAMQDFTHWTNLSEAAFVLPPTPQGRAAGADYRLRIFCPGRELPFAGHPTLGSCHAWLEAGGRPQRADKVLQECGVGLVALRRDGERLAFAAPALIRNDPLDEADVARIVRGLGVERSDILHHAWCANGPHWRGLMLRSAQQVLALRPDSALLAGLDLGVVGAMDGSDSRGIAFEVRAFFTGNNGLIEDPVTGSLNAALAQWLIGAGLAPAQYVASQGSCLGRAGRVHVRRDGADIWVGGSTVTCVTGEVLL